MIENDDAEFLLMKVFRMFFITVILCYTAFIIYCKAFKSATI